MAKVIDQTKDSSIVERRTFHLPVKSGGNIDIDVNWNKEVTPCKYLKLRWGDKEGVVWLGDLYNLMMFWVDAEKRKGLISKDLQNVKSYETILGIKTVRPLAIGEELKIAATIQVDESGRRAPQIFTKGITYKSPFEI